MSFVCLSRVQQVCNAFATLRNSTEPTEPWTNCCTCAIWACCICCICCLRPRRDLLGYWAWLKTKTSLFWTMLASFQRIEPIESVCTSDTSWDRYAVKLLHRIYQAYSQLLKCCSKDWVWMTMNDSGCWGAMLLPNTHQHWVGCRDGLHDWPQSLHSVVKAHLSHVICLSREWHQFKHKM